MGPYLVGVVPPTGSLSVAIPTTLLPASSPDGVAIACQLFVDSNGVVTMEAASAYVQVKAGT